MRSILAMVFSSCLLLVACNDGGPGAGCNPGGGGNGGCQADLVCADDGSGSNLCQIPLGGECTLDSDPSYCVGGSDCIEVTVTDEEGNEVMEGRCYLGLGDTCDPTQDVQCDPALQCAPMASGGNTCQLPVAFRGMVTDSATDAPIEGAHIIALDITPTAATDVSISDVDGTYRLDLPVPRNDDGTPQLGAIFTLRASADGYLTFPGGIRQALPVDSSIAVMTTEGWFIEGTLADIKLVEVADPSAPRITISGSVVVDAENQVAAEAGVLVVANPNPADATRIAPSALSDLSGEYTIFNVTPGEYEVRGYRSGLQLTAQTVTAADADLTDVDLPVVDTALSSISGTMQIVADPSCDLTSVVLAVESTFDDVLGRGELPATLRAPPLPTAPNIGAGATWTINDIPDGRYVVLAAFENDSCVRDPDTSIAGTAVVHVELPSGAGTLSDTFKVTGALDTVSPGAEGPEEVTEPPLLQWEGASGDDNILIEVFDAYGDIVWMMTQTATTNATESIQYAGPFESGMFYQFRATSRDNTDTPLQRTEDLRGVFFVP